MAEQLRREPDIHPKMSASRRMKVAHYHCVIAATPTYALQINDLTTINNPIAILELE